MAHLLIDPNGVIANIIIVDDATVSSEWTPPEGYSVVAHDPVVHGHADIGWHWDGQHVINPNPPEQPAPPAPTKVL